MLWWLPGAQMETLVVVNIPKEDTFPSDSRVESCQWRCRSQNTVKRERAIRFQREEKVVARDEDDEDTLLSVAVVNVETTVSSGRREKKELNKIRSGWNCG